MADMRDMTVGELMDHLREYPAYWPVLPVVNGVEGVLTAVRARPTYSTGTVSGPAVWLGEVDIPPHLQEVVIERARNEGKS